MALTAEQVTAAKAEAKEYLEYSTYVLCLALSLDPADVNDPYTVPVAADHVLHSAHDCLRIQVAAHAALP
jgi:hypothetical protein